MYPLKETMREFMTTFSLCGYESLLADKVKAELQKYTDDVVQDKIGNVIATFPGSNPAAPRVMLFAHMDTLGFIVRCIDDDGYIRFDRLGGIPEKILPALEMTVGAEDGVSFYKGVVGNKAHHVTPPEEKYVVNKIPELYIDIGCKSGDEVRALGIQVGCPICYTPTFRELQNGRVSGTAIDDKAGVAALCQVASMLKGLPHEATIYVVGTCWEEFNLRGAMMAARTAKCDLAISLDCAQCGDTPDLHGKDNVTMDNGPVMVLYDFHGRGTLNGYIAHKNLRDHALACAKRRGINLQRTASIGTVTDACYLQFEGEGIGMLELAWPTRYTHTPIETSSLADIAQLAELTCEMAVSIDANFPLGRFEDRT
ncbi:M42 family metallopeptidase [Feifania hominis]|uniref:M20/M25/M40 family metallo-hydrolase n=1 Tax=Feifania hominis TaxID=2763660 RepID=A0A926DDD7_9FIRM|nr:M20/M25/M40 family metallo-hydrolase [Feifania hominis]MBC8535792.1 M20/M25/M40 family metallo-hydrolase [Feifania hominis]